MYTVIGKIVTIQELMEEQRRRVRSSDPAERFAAALLLPVELAERLRTVSSFRLGELLEHEVCSNLNLLAPELTVCAEAAERLRRTPGRAERRFKSYSSTLDGEHLLHAEVTLYRAGIPYLLLPFLRDRFASSTFFLKDVEQARTCLLEADFCEVSRCATALIHNGTRRAIHLYEDKNATLFGR